MQLNIEHPFYKQKALETCRAYYRAKGYSDEHCNNYIDHLDDWNLERIYNIICEELEKCKIS